MVFTTEYHLQIFHSGKSTTQIIANMRGDFTCFRESGDSILAAHFDVVGFIRDSSFVVLATTPDDFPDFQELKIF
ncbi:MAG: hypothetical protein IPL22_07960 [Bacteroidetes bacterium]|nr:hypothetical protein [Bacteroidota bacterium]